MMRSAAAAAAVVVVVMVVMAVVVVVVAVAEVMVVAEVYIDDDVWDLSGDMPAVDFLLLYYYYYYYYSSVQCRCRGVGTALYRISPCGCDALSFLSESMCAI
jgi:hypothetical protein